jgi:uncharacterized protein (TIGR03067 family)
MRVTILGTLLVAPFAAAAPGPRDPPPKASALVGEWEIVNQTVGGRTGPWTLRNYVMVFTAEGKHTVKEDGRPRPWLKYRADEKADPPTLDIGDADEEKVPVREWLFRVDGDALTLSMGPGSSRPKNLESPKGAENLVFTLKRVKAKK